MSNNVSQTTSNTNSHPEEVILNTLNQQIKQDQQEFIAQLKYNEQREKQEAASHRHNTLNIRYKRSVCCGIIILLAIIFYLVYGIFLQY